MGYDEGADKQKRKDKTTKIVLIIILVFVMLISVYPFIYMILISFMKTSSMKLSVQRILNAEWSINNYVRIFGQKSFLTYFKNSTIMTIYAVIATCITAAMAAYAFGKKKFPGKEKLFLVYLSTMMISSTVTLIPVYLIIVKLKMLNTFSAMVLPTCNAFGTILMHQFMRNVPNELLEAADIDGCSEIYKFIKVVLPLMKPVIISLAIFTFISVWGSLVLPLIVTTKNDMTTLQVAIAAMRDISNETDYGLMMAGSTVAFLPPFILYLILQKQFVEGIALSGTKM